MSTVAVLDANVLFPMVLRDTLLRVAAAGCYRAHWSDRILGETTRNLIEQLRMSQQGAARLIAEMQRAFPDAAVEGWEHLEDGMPNHPKDRHVAAAAIHAGATLVVTANLKDFAALPLGLRAVGPDEFLKARLADMPQAVLSALARQARAYRKPPTSLVELLDWLEPTVPAFVKAARLALEEQADA